MKTEIRSLGGRIMGSVREYFSRRERIDEEYRRAYASCFEGSDEEVARKLACWDSVHGMTRYSSDKGGLF